MDSAETASPMLLPPRRAIKQEVPPQPLPTTTAQHGAQAQWSSEADGPSAIARVLFQSRTAPDFSRPGSGQC